MIVSSPRATISITSGQSAIGLAVELIRALKATDALNQAEKEEAVEDALSLKDELEKKRPNSKVVIDLLQGLSQVSLASEYVAKINHRLGY